MKYAVHDHIDIATCDAICTAYSYTETLLKYYASTYTAAATQR